MKEIMSSSPHNKTFPARLDPISGDLEFQIVDTLESFESLESSWAELFIKCSNATVFQSYSYNRIALKYNGTGRHPAIAIVKEKDQLVGIAPLWVIRRVMLPELEIIGSAVGAYSNIVVLDDRDDIIYCIAKGVASVFPKGVIHIPYYGAGEVNLEKFFAAMSAMGWKCSWWVRNISHYLGKKGDFKEYIGNKSPKIRYNLRREFAALEKTGNVYVSHYTSGSMDQGVIQRIASVQSKSWLARRGQTSISDNFHDELIRVLSLEGMAETYILTLDDSDIAYVLQLSHGPITFCYYIGFDEDFKKLAPGKYLIHHCLEKFHDNGNREYDFLFGDGQYKRFWSTGTRMIMRCVVYKGIVSWVLAWFPHRLHGALSNMDWLRRKLGDFRRLKMTIQKKLNYIHEQRSHKLK